MILTVAFIAWVLFEAYVDLKNYYQRKAYRTAPPLTKEHRP